MLYINRIFMMVLFITFVIVGVILKDLNILLISIVIIFFHNILYTCEKFYNRIVFFVFNVSIFVFLVARMVVSKLFEFNHQTVGYFGTNFQSEDVIYKILILLNLTLIFLFLGFKMQEKSVDNIFDKKPRNRDYRMIYNLRKVSSIVFLISFTLRIVYLIEAIKVSQSSGYFSYFSNFHSSLPFPIVMISEMMPVAFFFYLATFPNKKRALFLVVLYLFEGVVSMFTGSRSDFMLNILIIFVYFAFRNVRANYTNDDPWLGKKEWLIAIVSLPIIVVILNTVETIRNEYANSTNSVRSAILSFFYDQGVSVNVIGYTETLKNSIPDKLYTFGPIIEFFKFNIFGKLSGQYTELHGQTIERAMEGYQYSHTISYLVMPEVYLKGVGYGSSYVAELYHDCSYIGLILGSVLIGILIGLFTKLAASSQVLYVLLALIMIRKLFFIPRASTIAFVIETFSPINIFTILFILGFTYILKKYSRKTEVNINKL